MENWKKGYVFGHIDKFWKGRDGQIKKNACKNAYLGFIFISEKYVFRVCFESPFTRMISNLKYKCPPPPPPPPGQDLSQKACQVPDSNIVLPNLFIFPTIKISV